MRPKRAMEQHHNHGGRQPPGAGADSDPGQQLPSHQQSRDRERRERRQQESQRPPRVPGEEIEQIKGREHECPRSQPGEGQRSVPQQHRKAKRQEDQRGEQHREPHDVMDQGHGRILPAKKRIHAPIAGRNEVTIGRTIEPALKDRPRQTPGDQQEPAPQGRAEGDRHGQNLEKIGGTHQHAD